MIPFLLFQLSSGSGLTLPTATYDATYQATATYDATVQQTATYAAEHQADATYESEWD